MNQKAGTDQQGKAPCDILIRNATVLSMDKRRTIYACGAVAITGRTIAAVGPERDVLAAWRGRRELDAGGAVVHPGFIDCHYHVSIHLSRGIVPDDPKPKAPFAFGDWFNNLTDADEFIQAQCVAVEMLRNGYTFFLEPGTAFAPDAVAEGAAAVGVRGSVGDPFLWDVIDGGNALPPMLKDRAPCSTEHAVAALGKQLKRNADPDALVRGHVVIYGSGSQTIELMRAAKDTADRNGVVFNMHHNFTAEQTARDDARLGGGRHSLTVFAEHGLLGPSSTFVHMNVIRDDELPLILSSGMSLVWQPGNYMFYGVHDRFRGRMAEVLQGGGRVAFGVDTAKIWTFGDLELIGYLVARQTGGYISTAKIMEMRTVDAAKAAGVDHLVGSIEVGKRADIVIRSAGKPEAAPGVNPVQELLLGGHATTVRTVLVDGVVVVMNGEPTRVDMAEVLHAGRTMARRILSTAGYTPHLDWPLVN